MSEQVFSTFSSPCLGVKTVYNYVHSRTTEGMVGGGGVIFSSPLQGVRQTISRGPGGGRQIEECQMKKYSKTILSLCTACMGTVHFHVRRRKFYSSQKSSQLNPLSYVNRANTRYFILHSGISCELAGYEHRPIMDSESTIAGGGQTKS